LGFEKNLGETKKEWVIPKLFFQLWGFFGRNNISLWDNFGPNWMSGISFRAKKEVIFFLAGKLLRISLRNSSNGYFSFPGFNLLFRRDF